MKTTLFEHRRTLRLVIPIAFSILLLMPSQAATQSYDLSGTVTDREGNACRDARVLLVLKSWPNGRYQQQVFDSTTDNDGNFSFDDQYQKGNQTAYLVTVLAEGRAMESEYVLNKTGKKQRPFKFKLGDAIEKTFVFKDADGKPMAGIGVYPSARTAADGSEYLVYGQSSQAITVKTDDEGKVPMKYFAAGDTIKLAVATASGVDEVEIKVNASSEQTVGSTDADLTGTVANADGRPISRAQILLIHKSWPNGRYQQNAELTETDDDGKFSFPSTYKPGERCAFLVSVVADGWVLRSEYVMNEDGKVLEPFEFTLEKALNKTFILQSSSGKPLSDLNVYPTKRMDTSGNEHLIYSDSGESIAAKSNGKGEVRMNWFTAGDEVELVCQKNGTVINVNVTIDDSDTQSITVRKSGDQSEQTAIPKPAAPDPVKARPEQVVWLNTHAIPLNSIDPDDTDFSDLEGLKKLVGDAQIVQLGEQSHGDGACFQTKIRLIKFLHREMGFDVLSFESGLFDCHRSWQAFKKKRNLSTPLNRAYLESGRVAARCVPCGIT